MTYYKLLLIFKKEEGFDKKNKKVLTITQVNGIINKIVLIFYNMEVMVI